ncbi:bifunctional 4-hydroxy-2-oxoglutarate aldolase/2-dehydro-3-deoxy-phosphogluconate aldolase [soil metagenome]
MEYERSLNMTRLRKPEIVQRILQAGMVAIVRSDSAEKALSLAQACIAGGMTALEIAFTTPGTTDVITALRRQFGARVLIGAGTVLDPETARAAILAGAQFIISPSLNPATIRLCLRYQIPSMPGAMTPTEILEALEAGADIVKVFPGEAFGPPYVKAVLAALPQAPLMPTGGVTLDNLHDWFAQGSVAVGIGGSLTAPGKEGDYNTVTLRAREFVKRMGQVERQG